MNITYQLRIKQEIPSFYGPLDYRIFRSQLKEIDKILTESDIEEHFLLKTIEENDDLSGRTIPRLSIALRSTILATLLNESYRDLAFRFADSSLCQWFIGIPIGKKTPSKSTIAEYEKIWSKDEISALIHLLNETLNTPEKAKELIATEIPLDFSRYYVDSTCIQANVHYPVDWVLLRDAVRTIIAAIKTIRNVGLFHRMPSPDSFLTKVNTLSMAMTQASRNRNGKKAQKNTFRRMKRVVRTVEQHGLRYLSLLEKDWRKTSWSLKEAEQVCKRIRNVTEQISDSITLAHNRIIRGEQAKNEDKILSLYEKDVHVIKRGKAQAEIEYGNGFYLAEQSDGFIVDWDFFQDKPTADTKVLPESIDRLERRYTLASISTDRGFNSKRNSKVLEKRELFDATCPRNIQELQQRAASDSQFCIEQKRRAQTEARIGILKGSFLHQKLRRKGFVSKEKKVLWAIFTHNIWVAARLSLVNQEEKIKKKAS